jgi:hypothetical protein
MGELIFCASSAVIEEISGLCKAGLASMGFFYFDFSDDEKQSRRGMLSSLLIQLCAQSDTYGRIISCLYSEHNDGSQYPSDSALIQCLLDMLDSPQQAPVYIVMDALDECPRTSGIPSCRQKVLLLLEELVHLNNANLHICVTSRPETDIEAILSGLTLRSMSLHNQDGQLRDIVNYINSVVDSDPNMQRWKVEDKNMVVDTLSRRADGM